MIPSIRAAKVEDIPMIGQLLHRYASDGRLLGRSESEIKSRLEDFVVSEINGRICGCGSLEIFTTELGEVRSLAVDPKNHDKGIGRLMVNQIESMAQSRGLSRIIALTYVPGFFSKLGYRIVSMESLPEKVFGVCVSCPKFDRCDEIAMQKELSPPKDRV